MKKPIILSLTLAVAALAFIPQVNAQVTVTTARVGTGMSTNGTFVFPNIPSNSSTDLANGKLFTVLAGVPNASGPISNLTNGVAQNNQDSVAQSFFANGTATDGSANIRVQIDLASLHDIQSINSYSWHTNARASQSYRVYGASAPTNAAPDFTAAPFRDDTALNLLGYTRIAEVLTPSTSGGQHGANIAGTIGQYRYILFDLTPRNTTQPRPTFYGEIDIYGTPTQPPSFPMSIVGALAPQTGYDLKWQSKPAKSYHLRTSTDLATPIDQWESIAQNIPHTQPLNTYNVPQSGPRRFYAVQENAALPLLFADFEASNNGFTVSTTAGSAWQYGTPTSGSESLPNLGGHVSSGYLTSARCWGTNIGDPGYYLPNTVTRLRSPVIDLTNAAGAMLTFAEALDLNEGDLAELNIIHETNDTIIASAIRTSTDTQGNTANWNLVSPISLSAGIGQRVRLEWVLTAGSANDFMGWYIDHVTVTETAQ